MYCINNLKNRVSLFFILYFILFAVGSVAYAATSPVSMLEKRADQLILQLQKNKNQFKKNPEIVNNLVRKIVLPKVDKIRMARSVVPRQIWLKASSSEQQQFVKQFQVLVIRTYAAVFSEYTNESVKFRPLRGNLLRESSVQVQSAIIRPGKPPIDVSYSLARSGKSWKIYDFSVEGVSMVQSFRAQFAGLGRSRLSELTRYLKQHNATKK